MMNPLESGPVRSAEKASMMAPLFVGFGAFAVGAVMAFGYIQWNAQQQKIQQMAEMMQKLQQPASLPTPVIAPAPAPEIVTRNAPVDLLAVVTSPEPAVNAAPTSQRKPEPVSKTPAMVIEAAVTVPSTADRIRALVSRSSDPLVSAALAQDAARRETMSVAIQGVNELVEAAMAGKYELNAMEDGGGVQLSFKGHEEDQAELEHLLSSAAAAGMIAFNPSVKGSDGSYEGKIILFDLIERALVHGTPEERAVGNQIRQEALALLGTSNSAIADAAPADATGDRVYTVESGDSLAYIALQFYGNTNAYLRIYQANRDKLSTPDKIQVGQKLVIPSA